MKVFISWSGPLSHEVAVILRAWLPTVIQAVEPWVSSEDIGKGSQWYATITRELANCRAAIVVVTTGNQHSVWVNYETGALAKTMLDSGDVVAPLLVDLQPHDIRGPMAQLQLTQFERHDVLQLVASINRRLSAPLSNELLLQTFASRWPTLNLAVAKAIQEATPFPYANVKLSKQEARAEEIVRHLRILTSTIADAPTAASVLSGDPSEAAFFQILRYLIDSHDPITALDVALKEHLYPAHGMHTVIILLQHLVPLYFLDRFNFGPGKQVIERISAAAQEERAAEQGISVEELKSDDDFRKLLDT